MVRGLHGSKGCRGQSWDGSWSPWLRLSPMFSMVMVSMGYGYIKAGKTLWFWAVLGFGAGFGVSYVMGMYLGLTCSFYIPERPR